jgi:hypothetical protein
MRVEVTPTSSGADVIGFGWCATSLLDQAAYLFSLGYNERGPDRDFAWIRFESALNGPDVAILSKSSRLLPAKVGGILYDRAFSLQNAAERLGPGDRLCGSVRVALHAGIPPDIAATYAQGSGPLLRWRDPWATAVPHREFVSPAGLMCVLEIGYVSEQEAIAPVDIGEGYNINSLRSQAVQHLCRSDQFKCQPSQ